MLIEIDVLAKACGLPMLRYRTFPPVHFAPVPVRLAPEQTEAEPNAAMPELPEPAAASVAREPEPAARVEPVLVMARTEPIVPPPAPPEPPPAVVQPEPVPAEIKAAPIEPPPPAAAAAPQSTLAAFTSRIRQGGVTHPPLQVLDEIAAAVNDAAPAPIAIPRSRPSRRRTRSAGRTVLSALRSN